MSDADRERPPARPNTLSRIALFLAKRIPRGYWPLIRFAAERDPALWDYQLPLTFLPGTTIRADLRETVWMNFLRHGCIAGQEGHDLLFSRLVSQNDVVFDVGANVGYTMTVFSVLVGSGGKVVAIEPGRRAFIGLARNAEHRPNVSLLQAAASDRAGEAVFYEAPMNDLSSLERVADAVEFVVPTITVDRIAEQEGPPALVKIDVEGHEPGVLRGMMRLLGSARPPIIVFEALTPELRDKSIATIKAANMAEARFFRLRHDGTIASDLAAVGTNDYVVLPGWAEQRLRRDDSVILLD